MPDRPGAIHPVAVDDAYLRWLLYGDPGVGKSVLAASAANDLPTLILKSRSDKIQSVALRGYKADVWELEGWNDAEEAHTYLRYEDDKYQEGIVVFDTVTLFQELGLEDIMVDLIENQNKTHRKVYLPDKGEYGQNMNRLSKLIRDLSSMNFHFVVIAHAFVWQEDQQDEERRWPLIQGKGMPAKIAGYMNFVTYMTAGTNDEGVYVRQLNSRKEEDYYAKDGWDAFPKGFMNDPTFPRILQAIEGKTVKKSGSPSAKKVGPAKKAAAAKKAGASTKKTGAAKKAGARKASTSVTITTFP